MTTNLNGELVEQTAVNIEENRAFLYGDAVFETIKVLDGKILFAEDHYFRLMAAMRILRMEIPMDFNADFFENEILKTVKAQKSSANSFVVRMTCYRKDGGKYLPKNRSIGYFITARPLAHDIYEYNTQAYEVDLFKDFHISKHLLSTIKTTNKLVHITASIFADENDLQNVLLINDEKNVVEATNGNIFLISGNQIITPPTSDGCIGGIMRKKIIERISKWEGFEFIERSISPFELQKADEFWITNVIMGVQPVSKHRGGR